MISNYIPVMKSNFLPMPLTNMNGLSDMNVQTDMSIQDNIDDFYLANQLSSEQFIFFSKFIFKKNLKKSYQSKNTAHFWDAYDVTFNDYEFYIYIENSEDTYQYVHIIIYFEKMKIWDDLKHHGSLHELYHLSKYEKFYETITKDYKRIVSKELLYNFLLCVCERGWKYDHLVYRIKV